MSEEKKWVLGLKRAISFIICLIILFTYPTKLMAAQEPPKETELFAKAAVLMDGDSGRVLYSKNGSEALANASTTRKKDNISCLCVRCRNRSTLVINALCRGSWKIVYAAVGKYPADKAGAVKAR